MIIVTDAGRKGYKPSEINDCAVRAFAKIFSMSYREAHTFFEKMGRQEKRGYPIPYWLYKCWVDGQRVLGKRIEHRFYLEEIPRYTVAEFIRLKAPKGIYMVHVKDHVFALINGIIYDDKKWPLDSKQVISYFKFV